MFVVSFLIHMLHCCFSLFTWSVLLFLFHVSGLDCHVGITHGFFYGSGVGMG
jgi:hypothetical protein